MSTFVVELDVNSSKHREELERKVQSITPDITKLTKFSYAINISWPIEQISNFLKPLAADNDNIHIIEVDHSAKDYHPSHIGLGGQGHASDEWFEEPMKPQEH